MILTLPIIYKHLRHKVGIIKWVSHFMICTPGLFFTDICVIKWVAFQGPALGVQSGGSGQGRGRGQLRLSLAILLGSLSLPCFCPACQVLAPSDGAKADRVSPDCGPS